MIKLILFIFSIVLLFVAVQFWGSTGGIFSAILIAATWIIYDKNKKQINEWYLKIRPTQTAKSTRGTNNSWIPYLLTAGAVIFAMIMINKYGENSRPPAQAVFTTPVRLVSNDEPVVQKPSANSDTLIPDSTYLFKEGVTYHFTQYRGDITQFIPVEMKSECAIIKFYYLDNPSYYWLIKFRRNDNGGTDGNIIEQSHQSIDYPVGTFGTVLLESAEEFVHYKKTTN